MNHDEFLLSLQNRGLRAWQANFVAAFLAPDSAAFHLLTAPPGTGKSYASIVVAAELALEKRKRMLVLPPATLCEEWRSRLGDAVSDLAVLLVTRQVFREMEAAVPIGESPWDADGVYVISQDLAKQDDIAFGLSANHWDLVIVDEAHRLSAPKRAALVDRMTSENAVQRLLLLTATPFPSLEPWLHPSPDEPVHLPSPLVVTSWYGALKDWNGATIPRQLAEVQLVTYRRNPDEVSFLSDLLRSIPDLESAAGGNWGLTNNLTRRASSSLFAIEQFLQRLQSGLQAKVRLDVKLRQIEQDLGPIGDILNSYFEAQEPNAAKVRAAAMEPGSDIEDTESTEPAVPSEWNDLPAGVAVIKQCLDALDCVISDAKLDAVKRLIQSIIGTRPGSVPQICVFSMYAETVSYLHTALEDLGLGLFKLTGASSFAERDATVDQFLREGGVILGTDAAISEGIAMPNVSSVVHYDLPSTALAMARRCGRFDRFGRTAPLTMFVLKDESEVLAIESRLIEQIALNQDNDADKEQLRETEG